MTILPYSPLFDQQTMERLLQHDPVAQHYRQFLELFDWSLVPECGSAPHEPGRRPIPKAPMSKPSSFRFVKATRPTSAILTKKYDVP